MYCGKAFSELASRRRHQCKSGHEYSGISSLQLHHRRLVKNNGIIHEPLRPHLLRILPLFFSSPSMRCRHRRFVSYRFKNLSPSWSSERISFLSLHIVSGDGHVEVRQITFQPHLLRCSNQMTRRVFYSISCRVEHTKGKRRVKQHTQQHARSGWDIYHNSQP